MLNKDLKKLLKEAVEYLACLPDFRNISLKGETMEKGDKPSFYSYMRGTKVVNRQQKILNFAATIYVNFNDVQDDCKLLDAIAHEAAHIKEGDFLANKEYFRQLLRKKFGV